jgi:hypothetical protein
VDRQLIDQLVAEEDLALGDLLNACDDYCEAVAGGEAERAEDAQRSRSRAKARLSTVHERLKRAVAEFAS